MTAGRKQTLNEAAWARLEKVWTEEGLSIGVLSQRFGVNKTSIARHLREKFGTAKTRRGPSSLTVARAAKARL